MKPACALPTFLALSSLLACGSSEPRPRDDAAAHATSTDVVGNPSPAATTSTSATDAETAAPSASATVSVDALRDDVRSVCQGILDSPQLAPYLTPIPSRIPVHMVADGPCRDMKLEKHGKAVLFDGTPRSLHVKEVSIGGSTASAKIVYPGEGLTGSFTFEREPGGFKLVKGSVAEH